LREIKKLFIEREVRYDRFFIIFLFVNNSILRINFTKVNGSLLELVESTILTDLILILTLIKQNGLIFNETDETGTVARVKEQTIMLPVSNATVVVLWASVYDPPVYEIDLAPTKGTFQNVEGCLD
jgi:hypothetical protein